MSRLVISVVIPCYNGARHLHEALASVRAQLRQPLEVILVDDGSTDDSRDIAEAYGARVVTQVNRGEGAARNAGIRAASGQLVASLDADDRWRPHHLSTVAALLDEEPTAVGAFGAVQRFGSKTNLIPGYVRPGAPVLVLEEAFNDWLHTTISSVVRRDALLSIGGFDENERSAVDFDLWLRLAASHRFVATHEVTADWRMHAEQQSAKPWVQLAAVYRFRRRFLENLHAVGDSRAQGLERAFNSIWKRDCRRSYSQRDYLTLRALLRAAPVVEPWRR